MSEREAFVYWISRDSVDGKLLDLVHVWFKKPQREVRANGTVNWFIDGTTGCYGGYTLECALDNYGTIPETDLELVRAEQWAPDKTPQAQPKKKLDFYK